jgi:transcription elongation factor Elf1
MLRNIISRAFDKRDQMKKFVCPKCGEDQINELSVCVVSNPVTGWTDSGEPTRYGGPIVDWQSDYSYNIVGGGDSKITFECSNCRTQFEQPKRAADNRLNNEPD